MQIVRVNVFTGTSTIFDWVLKHLSLLQPEDRCRAVPSLEVSLFLF